MHEMAIAGAVLDAVSRHAGGRRVRNVRLRVGQLRQVVPSALEFAWTLITRDTIAEGSVLGIEAVAAAVLCRGCGRESEQRHYPMRCRACGSLTVEVVRGEELSIEWLEVDTDAGATDDPECRTKGAVV